MFLVFAEFLVMLIAAWLHASRYHRSRNIIDHLRRFHNSRISFFHRIHDFSHDFRCMHFIFVFWLPFLSFVFNLIFYAFQSEFLLQVQKCWCLQVNQNQFCSRKLNSICRCNAFHCCLCVNITFYILSIAAKYRFSHAHNTSTQESANKVYAWPSKKKASV